MVGGEPEAVRALGQVGQADRLVLPDEGAEHAASGRAGADGALLFVAEPDGQELIETPARPRSGRRAPRTAASTRSRASSMIRRSTTGRFSSASRMRIACTSRRSLAGSSILSKGCTARQDRGGTDRACGGSRRCRRVAPPPGEGRMRPGAWQYWENDDSGLPPRRSRAGADRAAHAARGRGRHGCRRRGGNGRGGTPVHPRAGARRGHPRRPAPRRQRHRGLPGGPVPDTAGPLPHADLVLRRRRPVLLHHGGRLGLRPQGGRRRRSAGGHPPGLTGHVAAWTRC